MKSVENFIKGIQKEGKEVPFSEAADIFQGIPHSHHSSQVFIISSLQWMFLNLLFIKVHINMPEKKNTTTVKTLISQPTTSST